MLLEAQSYHAHVYFHREEAEAAQHLYQDAKLALSNLAAPGRVNHGPIGPHPVGSFSLEFTHANRETVLAWLEAHRSNLTVMLHPETGDDLVDHRDHVAWLGEPMALDLFCFMH